MCYLKKKRLASNSRASRQGEKAMGCQFIPLRYYMWNFFDLNGQIKLLNITSLSVNLNTNRTIYMVYREQCPSLNEDKG